jgi:hypothetical protein
MSGGVPGLACRDVFLTCQSITPDLIFTNGLNQNIIILYRLFEIIGWKPTLLVNGSMDMGKLPSKFRDVRWITLEKYLQSPFEVRVLLEIGINMAEKVRNLFHMMGARVLKLYLGNSLNIDTEMSLFSPQVEIIQHKPGDIDMLLTSPHYADQLEYLRKLNGLSCENAQIAPYVWDPMFIDCDATASSAASSQRRDILIFEPNISFQKCCVIPLLICEKYYMENPEFSGKVHVFNTDKYNEGTNFFRNLLDRLTLWKDEKIELHERHSVQDIMKQYPDAVILCHQTNNEYNYMYLEAFYKGFPLVHNAESWSNGGWYYDGCDIEGGATVLGKALSSSKGEGVSEEKEIIWHHSIYNTANQEGWLRLLEDRT